MRKHLGRFNFQFVCGMPDRSLPSEVRYRYLCRYFIIIMMLITIIPLLITAMLGFRQYRQLLREETFMNARWSAESSRQTIEAFIEKLQATILIVSEAYTLDELSRQERLDSLFNTLKAEHKGLVDLSVIGPDGIQRTYAGPYKLAGKDYSDSPWYNQALHRKIFVSEVFLGYRNVPHFVIAASKRSPSGNWILRASIDAKTLDDFIATIDPEFASDIFLINSSGRLQTTSRFQGKIYDDFPLLQLPKKSHIDLMEAVVDDIPILRASGYIRGTPWVLVLDQANYMRKKNWLAFKDQLWLIVVACILFSGLIVIKIALFLTSRIREADEAREAAISQAEHTNKLASIGRLAAGVAHEINNPLAIINEKNGLMKDLLRTADDFNVKEKFVSQLNSMQKAVDRTKAITHRLLGFARRMDTNLELVQLNDLIMEVIDFLEKEAIYRNIAIDLHLDRQIPAIRGNQGQLQQVFLNIINNAFDAINEDGTITIKSSVANELVQIDITDTGPGMEPEVLRNIFEPFFTTKNTAEKQGTGLGLFITYGIIKRLGGNIVASSTMGAGTTFNITFPPADKEEHSA